MSDYSFTKARIVQWIGIILIVIVFAGAYWYFSARGSTLNQSINESLTNGAVGIWSFNGDDVSGTTASDRSGNSLNGTLTNGPTKVIGQTGQALNFDGTDDYVSVADNSLLDPADSADLTLTGWFYRDTFTTDDTIIAKRNGSPAGDAGYIVYIDDATDQLIVEVSDGTDEYSVTSKTTFTATGWHHFAIVWDQDSVANTEIYIDGVDNNGTDSGTIGDIGNLSNAIVLAIGAESDAGNPFDGKIDDVRAYSRTLSAKEIKSLYDLGNSDKLNSSVSQSQGTGRLDSGVAAYWPLDDGSGTGAADSSPNGNNGTLTNGPNWIATGQIGSAVDFDGTNDYISVADDISLDMTDTADFTLTGYFVRDSATTDDTILAKRNGTLSTDIGYLLYIDDATDQLIFEVSDGTDTYSLTSSSTFVSVLGTIYHFTVVWDQDSAAQSEIYIDGVADNATDTGTIGNIGDLSNAVVFAIGAESDVGNPLDGKLDEIRVYNRTLSAEEISHLQGLTTPTAIDSGLRGYWSFDGEDVSGTSAYDRSGVGSVETLTNGPTKVPGVVGQALNFDGTDDYTTTPDNNLLDIGNTADLTLTGWFYRDTANTDDTILAKKNSTAVGQAGYILYILASDDKLYFKVSDSTNEYQVVSTSTFTTTGWNHFAAVWDQDSAANTEIYINGTANNGTDTGTIGNVGSATNIRAIAIGAESDAGNPFDGKLDEIRIYQRTLSVAEIKSLYDQGSIDKINSSASQSQGTGQLGSGVLGYFSLDDNTGTSATDSSTNGNNGTLTNGPTWTTGQIGSAVDFDGTDDYVSIPDSGPLDMYEGKSFTLTGWFNRDTFTTDDTIVAKRNSITNTDAGYVVYVDDTTDKLTFEASDGTDELQMESTTTFTSTGWNHFALVWSDNSSLSTKLYVNGIQEAVTFTGILAAVNTMVNSVVLAIGAESDAGNPFDGKIDEVRVYDWALSAENAAHLYHLTNPTGIDTGLKGYWSFDGQDFLVSSTKTSDRSGADNIGTLTNGPTKVPGKIGQGINFDGTDDYINNPDDATLDILDTDDATIMGWFYRDTFTTDDTILAKRDGITSADQGYIVYIDDTTDKLTFEASDGTDEYQLESTSTFTGTDWYHFAIVWDQDSAGNSEIYINGVADSATDTGTIGNVGNLFNALALTIGTESDAGNPFDGKIDEVRVYKRTLSAAEIAAQYNSSR